jgi:hypothetical protein
VERAPLREERMKKQTRTALTPWLQATRFLVGFAFSTLGAVAGAQQYTTPSGPTAPTTTDTQNSTGTGATTQNRDHSQDSTDEDRPYYKDKEEKAPKEVEGKDIPADGDEKGSDCQPVKRGVKGSELVRCKGECPQKEKPHCGTLQSRPPKGGFKPDDGTLIKKTWFYRCLCDDQKD